MASEWQYLEDQKAARLAALAEMSREAADWDDDLPVVCLTHMAFVPDRREEPHQYSSDPADIERVRAWQHDEMERQSDDAEIRRFKEGFEPNGRRPWDIFY